MTFNRMAGTGLAPLVRRLLAILGLLALAACGGGGGGLGTSGSGGSGTTIGTGGGGTTTPVALTNFAPVTIDDGPAEIGTGTDGYRDANVPFVSVTICAPGSTTNCQTIDHVIVDTGSVGLRLVGAVVNSGLLSQLPMEQDTAGNPVGECYGFVDGYTFGSVRQADFKVGGEAVADMPLDIIGDTGAFATTPSKCSAGGGDSIATVKDLGANGILGIGTTPTDCGVYCASGGYAAAIYYDCPSSGCTTIIARASSTSGAFQQLPNPVAAMAVDNNGTILDLPAVPATGSQTLTGTLYFGIGTQSNNGLTAANVIPTTTNTSAHGGGLVTATYNDKSYPTSFIDSGSNAFFFIDSSIATCTDTDDKGYYCPPSPLSLTPAITGTDGTTASAAFTLYNAMTQFNTGYAAVPGVGANPSDLDKVDLTTQNFDFGLPFFFGRKMFTAIEGTTAGGKAGPYVAY